MGEFFRGWKRKAGLVTLFVACVFATAWMRSLSKFDLFAIELKRYSIQFVSTDELVGFQTFWLIKPKTKSNLRFISGRSNTNTVHTEYAHANFRARFPQFPTVPLPRIWETQHEFRCGRFRAISAKASWNDIQFVELRVPYWMIVMGLTLASTWLLFSAVRAWPLAKPAPNLVEQNTAQGRHVKVD